MRHRTRLALVAALVAGGIAPASYAQLDPNDSANKPAEIEPLAASSLLLDLAVAGNRLVAVGERGHVLLSDDQGATWRQAKSVPTRVMLTAVYFVDAQYGWAVGHDETILNYRRWRRKLDALAFRSGSAAAAARPVVRKPRQRHCGRRLWRLLHHQRRRPELVEREVRAAAAPGKDGPKHDGEAAPDEGELPPDYHLNRIVGVGNRLYVAAEGGQLYRSDDRGASWRALPSPYEGSFFGLVPIRGEGLLAFGLRGHLYRSADAGETWTELESHTTAMLTDGVAVNDLRVVIGGLAGVLLVSGDAGETFKLTQQDDRKGLSAVLPGPAGAVVVAGEGGVRTIRLDSAGS